MKQRLFAILNIKASESRQVFDLLTVQFFIGLASAILNIIAFTLFIYNFPITRLPYVYLCIAFVLLFLNIIYEKLEHRFSPLHLLKVVIGIAITLLLVLWGGLSFGNRHDFIFVLLVFNTIIYMLTGYAFWGLVSMLFNVRESRRVFSIVGAGDIPAKLIGYMIAPLLMPLIGLGNLLWLSVAALVTSYILFTKMIKKKRWETVRQRWEHQQHHDSHHQHSSNDIINFFFQNKLIFTISLLSILSYNVFILIDYTFISQVKLKFENISDLAIYIAAFFAVGRLIAILFKLIFTSRVIERLGIIAALFITPVALFVFCLLFFIFEGQSNYNVFIFGAMALLTEVLRSTMQEPVFFILFQPLKEQLRLKGHIIAKGYTLPPSLIVVGLSLLLLFKLGVPLTILFTIKVIIINLFVWVAAIFLIQNAYLSTLHSSIKKGIFNSDDKYIYDQTAIEILIQKVNSGKTTDVIYSLDLLKKAGYANLNNLLQEQLSRPNSEVKKYALTQLEHSGKANPAILQELLHKETDSQIRQKIVSILCRTDADYLEKAAENIALLDADTKKSVIINLMNRQEFTYLLSAGNEMNKLINSAHAAEKIQALSIITELKHVQFTKVISRLMMDDDMMVKREAIAAAAKLKITSLLPQLLHLANEPIERFLIIKSLQQYGDKLFNDIITLPGSIVQKHYPDLIKIAANIKGEHSRHFLQGILHQQTEQTSKTVQALWAQNYEATDTGEVQRLHSLLQQYLKQGAAKIHDYQNIPAYQTGKHIIQTSLVNEVKQDLVKSLQLSIMLYHKKQLNRILELIDIDNQHQLFNAMEMLELELPKKIAKELNQLLDFITDPAGKINNNSKPAADSFFENIYLSSTFVYNPWTKAIVMYTAWKNSRQKEVQTIQQQHITQDHLIITETRNFVLDTTNQQTPCSL